jgi:lipoic acid synthetase
MQNQGSKNQVPKPHWLKRRLPTGGMYEEMRALLTESRLHTVCEEARCPNIWECFSQQTSTFLIMGPRCTRNCGFCAVSIGPPDPPDPDEPVRVAQTVQHMRLTYVVVTSVTRDDLPDGGAGYFVRTIEEIRKRIPNALVEVLIPDFQGSKGALVTVVEAHPDVLNHNLETVPRLYPVVRPGAAYSRSLELLRLARQIDHSIRTKSGLMLGLGEVSEEVKRTLQDIVDTGCSILTLGQYLQPTRQHLPVRRFIPPEEFDQWRETALEMGFSEAACGPFVRSSYHARELYHCKA